MRERMPTGKVTYARVVRAQTLCARIPCALAT